MTAPARPRLMPLQLDAPHPPYFLASGKEVKGCTTMIKILGKEALNRWYFNLGAAGVAWEDVPKHQGMDLGKLIHARAEAYLKGYDGLDPEGLPPDLLELSYKPFQRFVNQWLERKLTVVASELKLVSESLEVGGTLDIVADGPDGLGVHDLKSSTRPYRNRPYKEWKIQVAGAHELLWNENKTSDHWRFQSHNIWRLGKTANDDGDFYRIKPEEVPICCRAFKRCVELFYDLRAIE